MMSLHMYKQSHEASCTCRLHHQALHGALATQASQCQRRQQHALLGAPTSSWVAFARACTLGHLAVQRLK